MKSSYIFRERAPRIAGCYSYDGKELNVYRSGNEFYISLPQLASCNTMGKAELNGGLVRYMNASKCIKIRKTKFVFAPADDVVAYLKRSTKKGAKNLFGFLTFILQKEEDKLNATISHDKVEVEVKVEEKKNEAPKVVVPNFLNPIVSPIREPQEQSLPFGGWCSPAEQYYAERYAREQAEERAKRSTEEAIVAEPEVAEPNKEIPGVYFDLSQFFDVSPLPIATYKKNMRWFTDEIKVAVSVMLRIGEPLRGEARQEFTNILSCLGNYQTLLNSINSL